jgi:hypothetical protein
LTYVVFVARESCQQTPTVEFPADLDLREGAFIVFSRDAVPGGTEPFDKNKLRWAEVSEDTLFGLVFPPIFLPILIDIEKGADESLGRYGKGIELSHRF